MKSLNKHLLLYLGAILALLWWYAAADQGWLSWILFFIPKLWYELFAARLGENIAVVTALLFGFPWLLFILMWLSKRNNHNNV